MSSDGSFTTPSTISASVPGERETEATLHTVTGQDTIAGLAVKYHVSVGEIKRRNKLMTDFDFFARSYITIPVPLDGAQHQKDVSRHKRYLSSLSSHDSWHTFGILEESEGLIVAGGGVHSCDIEMMPLDIETPR